MNNLWQRINILVPDPQCFTRDNKIIFWTDSRKRPTVNELLAVDLSSILNPDNSINKKIYEINQQRMKRMRVLISSNPTNNPETYMNFLACKKVMGTIVSQEDDLLTDLLSIFEASLLISSDMASDLDPASYDVVNNSLWP